MKYYDGRPGSNPLKVRIFMREKGIELPTVTLDLVAHEHRTPEYLAINSLGKLPALILDDGTVITESVAICRYLEALHPEPALFGRSPAEQGLVEMWCRRVEWELSLPCVNVIRHTAPFFADAVAQNRAYADDQRQVAQQGFAWLDGELADGRDFVAGDAFSMADILLHTTMGNARMMRIDVPDGLTNLHGVLGRIAQRESVVD